MIAVFTLLAGVVAGVQNAAADITDPTEGAWVDEKHPVVIELFTSTNCSACMIADRILYDISKNPNVIALSCHVKYWDENTLKDPTGLEACTYRQWAYKSSGRMDKADIKIPYIMVDGTQNINNDRLGHFYNHLQAIRHNALRKPLWIGMKWGAKDKILVTLPQTPRNYRINLKDSFSVWLIRYQDYIIQKVKDGDNQDRVLRFSNVVRKAKHIAKWHGDGRTIEVSVPVPDQGNERGGYVAIIHETNGSDIYAAGKVPDYKVRKPKKEKTAKTPSVDKQKEGKKTGAETTQTPLLQ